MGRKGSQGGGGGGGKDSVQVVYTLQKSFDLKKFEFIIFTNLVAPCGSVQEENWKTGFKEGEGSPQGG